FTVQFETCGNGRIGQSTVRLVDGERSLANAVGKMDDASSKKKAAKDLAEELDRKERGGLGVSKEDVLYVLKRIEDKWKEEVLDLEKAVGEVKEDEKPSDAETPVDAP